MNTPLTHFTNEHLNNFLVFRFESLSIGFESPKTTFQIWNSSSKNKEGNSNPSREDSNLDSRKFSLMKVI